MMEGRHPFWAAPSTSINSWPKQIVETPRTIIEPSENEKEIIEWARSSKAQSSLKREESAWKMFCLFCDEKGVQTLPARPDVVASYVKSRSESGKKAATIRADINAIKNKHKEHLLLDPTEHYPLINSALAAAGRSAPPSTQNQPVPTQIVQVALQAAQEAKALNLVSKFETRMRDAAVLQLSLSLGLRASDLVNLESKL